MTVTNSLTDIKFPSLIAHHSQDNSSDTINQQHRNHYRTGHSVLLPPILTNPSSPPPPSFSYSHSSSGSSTCSSSSFSTSPSPPPSYNYESITTTTTTNNVKKGSIQSILNSGSELLALEQKDGMLFPPTATIDRHSNKRVFCSTISDTTTEPSLISNKKFKTCHTNGLRLFSKQVCNKVLEKGTTTYNQVADELAMDIQLQLGNTSALMDQKNIRRRVYDALNVLMALGIIQKDRKEIKWLGGVGNVGFDLPNTKSNSSNVNKVMEEMVLAEEEKQAQLQQSLDCTRRSVDQKVQHFNRLKGLVRRNQNQCQQQKAAIFQLPFMLSTSKEENHEQSSVIYYADMDILATLWPITVHV